LLGWKKKAGEFQETNRHRRARAEWGSHYDWGGVGLKPEKINLFKVEKESFGILMREKDAKKEKTREGKRPISGCNKQNDLSGKKDPTALGG